MVHHFLASPFDDAARAEQFAAVRAALQAEAGPDTLLLGNLVLEDGAEPIDALVVRPHVLTLLVLVPAGGRLSVPAQHPGRWQLSGNQPEDTLKLNDPFAQLAQQQKAVADWLRPRFSAAQANLEAITGVVLFAAPVDFAPEATLALRAAPASYRLLTNAAEMLPCLQQLATSEINLSDEDLAAWVAEWTAFATAPTAFAESETAAQPRAADVLAKKARAFWGWLGAADVPDDPPYGLDPAASRREEKQRLEHLRQQMQADVAAQLQALEAREAERERSIAQLKAQLAQAPPVAADATALVSRLGAETREKAASEAQVEASRAESAARNRELDAKIQQLNQLIERLNAQPASPPPVPASPESQPADRPTRPAPGASFASAASSARHLLASEAPAKLRALAGPRFRQWRGWGRRRVGLVAGAVALLGLGAWGLGHVGGRAPVPYQENGRWGFANAQGRPVIPAQFTTAKPFQNGRAVVAKAGAYGFVTEDGQEVVAPAYDALNPYAGGYARARVGDAYTFIDEEGQEFDAYYFNALDFAEGHAAVLDHRGWHYISGPGEPEKPVIFREAYSFIDGLARVRLADGFTYITPDYLDDPSEGTEPFGRYQHASDFANGQARVTQNGRSFLIDKRGAEIK